jgi:phenylpropionate dioxygenase-like ring-hydroxylating dioxygenase large terminal subunit
MVNDPVLCDDWHVVARAEDVAEGKTLGVRLLGENLVLWRVNGQVLAWQDLCIHRGTRLSLGRIEGENLVCPYHGWTYNSQGYCVRIPAHPEQVPPKKARVKTYTARERYGWVWVSLGNPEQDVPVFPEWHDASYRKIFCGPYTFHASGPRAIENFLDVAHFPFVHEGLLGDQQHTQMDDYEAQIGPDGVTASDIHIWQPDPDGMGQGATVTYTYRVFRPLTAYFVKTSAGPKFAIYFAVTPVEEAECIGWMCMAMNYGYDVPEEQLRSFEDTIVAQDIPIVESQRPELLPLDLQAELHLRSDRSAIAYRKWLRQLGLTFGTA